MGDRFRSMIDSEFAEVDAPPIGDLVDNAIRDGRQLRRTRLVQRTVACAAAVGVLALGLGMATATLRPDDAPGGGYAAEQGPAGTVLPSPAATAPPPVTGTAPVAPDAPTMAIFAAASPSGVTSKLPLAAPETVLLALQTVLPPGRTVAYAGSRFDTYTGVQVFLDRGTGFGMIRVAVARYGAQPRCDDPPAAVTVNCSIDRGALVETFEIESNCVQRHGVTVYRLDGIAVQVNVGSCVPDGPWDTGGIDTADGKVLDTDEATRIALHSIWSAGSLDGLEPTAFKTYPSIPMLTAFNGVES